MHIATIPPASPAKTYPAYHRGRPVAVYHRRYRRRAPAPGPIG